MLLILNPLLVLILKLMDDNADSDDTDDGRGDVTTMGDDASKTMEPLHALADCGMLETSEDCAHVIFAKEVEVSSKPEEQEVFVVQLAGTTGAILGADVIEADDDNGEAIETVLCSDATGKKTDVEMDEEVLADVAMIFSDIFKAVTLSDTLGFSALEKNFGFSCVSSELTSGKSCRGSQESGRAAGEDECKKGDKEPDADDGEEDTSRRQRWDVVGLTPLKPPLATDVPEAAPRLASSAVSSCRSASQASTLSSSDSGEDGSEDRESMPVRRKGDSTGMGEEADGKKQDSLEVANGEGSSGSSLVCRSEGVQLTSLMSIVSRSVLSAARVECTRLPPA